MRAYALMQLAADLESLWLTSPLTSQPEGLRSYRERIGLRDARAYRGIERFPLTEWPEAGPGWQGHTVGWEDDPEPAARQELLRVLGPDDFSRKQPRAFVESSQDVADVAALLKHPDSFEMVELCSAPDAASTSLGFDVGYWGGGNFSILCDVAIWPTWHPPVDGALDDVARYVAMLNDRLLFPSSGLARDYLAWYSSQDWAETPAKDFTVMEVGVVTPAPVANKRFEPTP